MSNCPCKKKSSTLLLIQCANSDCPIVWWHAICAGFNKNAVKKDLEKIGAWICPCCVVGKLKICGHVNQQDGQSEILSKMDENLDTLQGHIADLKTIKEELSEMGKHQLPENRIWADVVKADGSGSVDANNISRSFASSVAKEVINQSNQVLHDRENREKNIIVFNAHELESEVVDERKKHDTQLLSKLCNHVVGESLSVDKINRIGKKNSNQDDNQEKIKKIRPMKICFTNAFDKRKFLSNLWKLKDAPSELTSLRIQHDLNKDERETTSRLLAEAYEKNKNEKPTNFLYKVRGPPFALRIVKIFQKKYR